MFLCEFEAVHRTHRTDLQRLDSILQVIGRTGGRCEVENVFDFAAIEGQADILLEEFETGLVTEMSDVLHAPSKQIVGTDDGVARAQQSIAQVRSDETCSACD